MLVNNDLKYAISLFRGLAVLNEDVTDKKTGGVCHVNKAWNLILDGVSSGKNISDAMVEADDRFELQGYQYDVLWRLSSALRLVIEEYDRG